MRHRFSRATLLAALSAVGLVLSLTPASPALAAQQTMTMSYAFPATAPTGSVGGINVSPGQPNDQGGFANVGVPWSGAIQNNTGVNRIMANYWNNNSVWAGRTNASQSIVLDDQSGAYHLSNFTASTYFPNGRPDMACPGGADINNACHWTPVNAHFPSDYPAIYKGCHFTQCSVATGAPYPMTLNSLISLPSMWHTTVPTAGTFDVAYDIWLDRGVQAAMPAGAASIGQNDGAEIMLWVSNRGYGANGATNATPSPRPGRSCR